MKLEGYKISGYDATYRKALFNVCERGNRVLEITDVDSGTTFLVDFNGAEKERRTSGWTERREKKQGQTIHFGRMGFFKELEYNTKKKE